MRVFLCLAIALVTSASRASEPADPTSVPPEQADEDQDGRAPAPQRRVLIYRVKHMPAAGLAESLERLIAREQDVDVVVIAEPVGNQLLISGTPKALSPVKEILEEVDQPPCQIHVEVLILHEGEEIGDDLSPKQVAEMIRSQRETDHHVVERIELTAVGNQQVTIQLSDQKPRIVGSTISTAGISHSVSMEICGTLVKLTAASPDRRNISIQFDYETSWLGSAEKGVVISEPKDSEPIRSPSTYSRQLATTLQLRDGETKIVRATRDATNRFVMAITASVVPEKRE